MKLILWLLLGLVVVYILRNKKKPARGKPPAAPPPPEAEAMLRCAECGLYLPASEALHGPVGAFCSEEHRRRHAVH